VQDQFVWPRFRIKFYYILINFKKPVQSASLVCHKRKEICAIGFGPNSGQNIGLANKKCSCAFPQSGLPRLFSLQNAAITEKCRIAQIKARLSDRLRFRNCTLHLRRSSMAFLIPMGLSNVSRVSRRSFLSFQSREQIFCSSYIFFPSFSRATIEWCEVRSSRPTGSYLFSSPKAHIFFLSHETFCTLHLFCLFPARKALNSNWPIQAKLGDLRCFFSFLVFSFLFFLSLYLHHRINRFFLFKRSGLFIS